MREWCLPDPHFFHKYMVHCCGRPEDFTERIVANWASRVAEGDLVIVLGDVILKEQGKLPGIISNLPGNKILVRGKN